MPDAPTITPACTDSDADGICDQDDDWPCGVKPDAPAPTLEISENAGQTDVVLRSIAFDGGSPLLVVHPGQTITMHFDYAITDTACPSECRDQIELGFVAGPRVLCAFDDGVPYQDGASGHIDQPMTAPTVGGVYDLRANLGQNLSCTYGGANDWWGATPGTKQAVAKLCVH